MSNDLVVQLGAKLDQFQSDLNQAGDIADSTVSKIESAPIPRTAASVENHGRRCACKNDHAYDGCCYKCQVNIRHDAPLKLSTRI